MPQPFSEDALSQQALFHAEPLTMGSMSEPENTAPALPHTGLLAPAVFFPPSLPSQTLPTVLMLASSQASDPSDTSSTRPLSFTLSEQSHVRYDDEHSPRLTHSHQVFASIEFDLDDESYIDPDDESLFALDDENFIALETSPIPSSSGYISFYQIEEALASIQEEESVFSADQLFLGAASPMADGS